MKRFALSTVLILAVASPIQALLAQSDPEASGDLMARYAFTEVEHALGVDGTEIITLRPEGELHADVELAVVNTAAGDFEAAVLSVDHTRLELGGTGRAMIAAFLDEVLAGTLDAPSAARLGYLIGHEDIDVRRGRVERTSRCCAIPPENPAFVQAVEVVDGERSAALVRWDEATVRFENGTGREGNPALLIRIADAMTPEEVLEALFDAAREHDADVLPTFCHPAVETDGDVEAVCALTKDSEQWESFIEAFSTGTVTGPAEIDGDRASVPFRFGPRGDRDETMELVRWGDVWYLQGF